jgi:hypothetical protein
MFPNLSRFLGLLIGQRDALRKVVDLDKRDLDLQAKLTAFRDGAVPRAGAGGVYFAPIGRTLQLLATIDPENGYGAADDAYQATIAEMIQGGLGSYLPLLRATHEAHRDLCSQARKAAERSGGVEDLASSLEVHCRVVMYLTDLANSQAYAKPETPVVGTAGGTAIDDQASGRKRGTKITQSRKIDVAITLVVRNPELDDAEIARRTPCDPSYLSRSEEYQHNADMARKALVRQQRHAAYDARSGETHPLVADPEVDG